MSGLDLVTDGFPHGTPEGYQQGCKGGGACAGKETGMTCTQANTLYQSDYEYRKLVDAGSTPGQIRSHYAEKLIREKAVRDAARAAEKPQKVKKVRKPARNPRQPQKTRLKTGHGSYTMGHRYCKVHEECPNFGTDLPTCREAVRDYQREWSTGRRARAKAKREAGLIS